MFQSEPDSLSAYANSSPFSEKALVDKATVPSLERVFGSKNTSGSASKDDCMYITLTHTQREREREREEEDHNLFSDVNQSTMYSRVDCIMLLLPLVLESGIQKVEVIASPLERRAVLRIVIEFCEPGI